MIVADHRFAFPVPNVEWIVMSDMDETNDAIDSQGDEVSASAYEMPARETAASHSKTVQNDSQNSREFPEEDPVESNCAMDKEAAQDSSEERHEDEAVEDEYEDESEDGDQEDESGDEYEDEDGELEDGELEDGELEDGELEDGDQEDESEDEYEDEDGELEDGDQEDESEDEYEDEEGELEDGDQEDESEDEYEDEVDEADDGDQEDESEEQRGELADRDLELPVSIEGDGESGDAVAADALESELQHSASHESRAKPSHESLAGDRFSRPNVLGRGEAPTQPTDSAKPRGLQLKSTDLPIMHGEPFGMRRADRNGCELLDAMAGRNSVFGFGCTPILESLVSGLSDYLGEGSRFADVKDTGGSALSKKLQHVFDDARCVSLDSMALLPSPDLAVEYALQLTRRCRSAKAFRTIALTGSDHGRTGMCRTASGQPQLHEGLGPMMAGFSHLPVGDLDALRAAMDEQTAGVILSPIDLGSGAVACEAEYLAGVRAACSERGVLLVIDETQLVFGATGNHFSFSTIADIQADIVVTSGGLFGGLSGGLVLASQHASTRVVRDLERYPLLAKALLATLDEMEVHGLPEPVDKMAQELAVLIAEQLSGFEFVRDMRVTGMTIGIECDVNAVDVVAAAAANGLRVESAGDTAIRIQPPLLISEEDRQLLLKRLVETMEAIERETAELTL